MFSALHSWSHMRTGEDLHGDYGDNLPHTPCPTIEFRYTPVVFEIFVFLALVKPVQTNTFLSALGRSALAYLPTVTSRSLFSFLLRIHRSVTKV